MDLIIAASLAAVVLILAGVLILRAKALKNAAPKTVIGYEVIDLPEEAEDKPGQPQETDSSSALALSFDVSAPSDAFEQWNALVRHELISAFSPGDPSELGDLASLKLDGASPKVESLVAKSLHLVGGLNLYQDILKNISAELGDASRLHGLIQKDQYLTLRLLSFANSPFFSPSSPVNSVSSAILIIGYANLRSFIYSEMLGKLSAAAKDLDKTLLLDLWEHGSLTALCASRLAGLFPGLEPGLLYTVGLVHDIGKILLCSVGEASQENVCALISNDLELSLSEENEIFGTNHCVLGMLIARELGLPEIICETIRLHHSPGLMNRQALGFDDTLADCALAVHLADRLAHLYPPFQGEPGQVSPIYPSFHGRVALNRLVELATDQALFAELKKAHAYVHGHHSKPSRQRQGKPYLDWV